MKKYPKILVGAPTYEGKDYAFNRWHGILTRLTYPNYKTIIVDNSPSMKYYNTLRRRGVRNVKHVPRGVNSRQAQARSLQYMRAEVLENDYDYMLIIESDLYPPLNIVEKLLAHDKPVVGASYEIGLHGSLQSPRRMCLYGFAPGSSKKKLDLLPIKEGYNMIGTGLQRVTSCGMGCLLIHRSVLEKIEFMWSDKIVVHSDMLFARDLWVNNIPIYADTNILVAHHNQNWTVVKDM